MKKKIKSLLFLLLMIFPLSVYAEDSKEIITGNYQYSAIEGYNKQNQNTFLYKDSDFTKSSFIGSKSLEVLSIQVAGASLSWYGKDIDKYEIDYTQNDYNIRNFLNDMKFNNIESNKYYNLEKKENSVGVIIGSKTIIQDNKEYTLLAIIPRSAGYKQEWAGNFTIGDGSIHEGFKSARDEILRFTKQYIEKNNITGNLKVWTTGYSRGAAIANMVGGFFAGGGIEYFKNNVSITPEDVYCYTIGTPSSIKDGASKNIELSVSANRPQKDYANDTTGQAYNYTKGGSVLVNDKIYSGIRNIISSDDAFPLLPLEKWGFTRYGKVVSSSEGLYSEEEMLKELKTISEYVYDSYTTNGKVNKFSKKTFDLKSLTIVDKESNMSQIEFFKDRLNGLAKKISTNKIYNDEYQDAMIATIGTYGMVATLIDDITSSTNTKTSDMIYPLIYAYLSYVSEELQNEGKANSEAQAVSLAAEELISYFTNEEINNETFKIDDFVKIFAKYMADNEKETISDSVISGILSLVPENYQSLLGAFKIFSTNSEATTEEGLKAFIKACYYGSDPQSSAYSSYQSAESVRELFYMTMMFSQGTSMPELQNLILDSDYKFTGHGKFQDFVEVILNNVKTIKDEDGNVIKTYNNIKELADDKLIELLDNLLPKMIDKSEELYGKEYKEDFLKQFNNMKQNITKIREAICILFFSVDGKYSTVTSLENALTLVKNAMLIAMPHFDEIYLALARTSNRYDDIHECIKGDGQTLYLSDEEGMSLTFSYDYYLFKDNGELYIDNILVPKDKYKITKGSTIITIDKAYLDSLELGNHIIVAKMNNEEVKANFTIEKNRPTNNETTPNTSDNIIISFIVSISSLLTLSYIAISNKKQIEL